MKTDNELIAEFMGLPRHPTELHLFWVHGYDFNCYVSAENLRYHSWDWLMPVVEKIEGMKTYISINANTCGIWNYFDPSEIIRGNSEVSRYKNKVSGKTKIEATYKAVVEFIKWYNLKPSHQQ